MHLLPCKVFAFWVLLGFFAALKFLLTPMNSLTTSGVNFINMRCTGQNHFTLFAQLLRNFLRLKSASKSAKWITPNLFFYEMDFMSPNHKEN